MVFPDNKPTLTHSQSVRAKVTCDYIPSDYIIDAKGGDDKKVEMAAIILPECKLPRYPKDKTRWFADNIDIHPFGHIRRSYINGEGNCEIVDVRVKTTIASKFDALNIVQHNIASATETLDVELPCIVNTKTIKAQEEVVLAWVPPPTETKQRKVDAIQ